MICVRKTEEKRASRASDWPCETVISSDLAHLPVFGRTAYVIRLDSCPLDETITCPAVGLFPCSIASEWYERIRGFASYPRLWSILGIITCPLVQASETPR